MPYLNSSCNFLSENVYFWYGRAKISQVKLSWSSRGATFSESGDVTLRVASSKHMAICVVTAPVWISLLPVPIERFYWRHAVLQDGRRIAQTDLDIQGSHAHHARTWSSYVSTTKREAHGETVTHNNVNRCLYKLILIAVAMEAAMLEDSITSVTSHENVTPNPRFGFFYVQSN